MRVKFAGASAWAENIAGKVTENAASAATAARRRRGEGITARRLHLAGERPWRGRLSRMDCLAAMCSMALLGPARNNCPDRTCPPTDFEGLDKGSIVTPAVTSSHIGVIGSAAALGRNPGDVSIGILDVARFAVDAVLRVDHEAR